MEMKRRVKWKGDVASFMLAATVVLFLLTTPRIDRFSIQANNITYNKEYNEKWYQMLFRVVLERAKPFVL